MSDGDSSYPPAPAHVPADLAKPGLRYRMQVVLVMLTLLLFLVLYLALMVGALGLMAWAAWPASAESAAAEEAVQTRIVLAVIRVSIFALALMLFVFLLKGMFTRGRDDGARQVEVSESTQPDLFHFINELCREIGCSRPARVCLSDEVNAAVLYPTSIMNLLVPPRKTLLIGLGLVNDLTLVEFKALLAHELGHFSQRTLRVDGYVWISYQMIANMVNTRDRWDAWVVRGFDTPWVSAFAVPLYVIAEWTRAGLKAVFSLVQRAQLAMRRQMEFNADLVAVSVAGSDALVRLLFKCNFAHACQLHLLPTLAAATEDGLFSRDLFLHQQRAGDELRALGKHAGAGRLPEPAGDGMPPPDVFQPEEVSDLAMWADHPSNHDREQNAKARYVPGPRDDRPCWLLFREQETIRAEATRLFYDACFNLTPTDPPASPELVQAFIDEELAATRPGVRYRGIYDNRCLELADDVLVDRAEATPDGDEKPPEAALAALYSDELAAWVEGWRSRRAEANLLDGIRTGRIRVAGEDFEMSGRRYPVAAAATLLQNMQGLLDEDRRYLANFDRSVFALYDRLAARQGKQGEHRQKYQFHLRLQRLVRLAWEQKTRVESALAFFHAGQQIRWEEVSNVRDFLLQVQDQLAEIYRDAGELTLPPLTHVKAGVPAAALLPPMAELPELTSADSYSALDLNQLAAFDRYVGLLAERLTALQAKSLVNILRYQEELAGVAAGASTPALSSPEG